MSSKGLAGNNNQVPPGYKKTEFGVIPEDWKEEKLINLCRMIVDCPHSTPTWTSSGFVVLRNQNIRHGKLDLSSPSYTDETHFIARTRRAKPIEGDLVITREAPIGEVCIIPRELQCCLGQRMVLLRPNLDRCDSQYILYEVQSQLIQKFIQINGGTGSTVGNLRIPLIHAIPIPLPPTLPEQKAIAQTLSDVDVLIAALDKLIAKKRNIKTATMQQLLTGKTRLPGFGEGKGYKKSAIGVIPEDWDLLEVADIVENRRIPSGIYKEKNLYGKGINIIKIGEVFALDYFNSHPCQKAMIDNSEMLNYRVNIGDIFIALASVKLEGVGKVMLVIDLSDDTVFDHNVALIRVNNLVESKYVFYIFKSRIARLQISQLATQVGTTFLKSSTILAFQFPIPPLPEQKAIAKVLSDIDSEITALEKRRAKTQAIKQGMMQELLTGKTRIINN
ncbi:MAG: restriction endonuclease subunit S [Microcoleus sp.]